MAKFKVVFAIDYEVEAEDENSAIQEAEERFTDEVEHGDRRAVSLLELFGVHAEEIEE